MPDAAHAPASDAGALPPCPITGAPALRRVQTLGRGLVKGIWRVGQDVDVSHLMADVPEIGLYEAPSGLMFFHPAVVGDATFYETYYAKYDFHALLNRYADRRADFAKVAAHARPGMRVVDVGCGDGGLGRFLPGCAFTGLDPYAGPDAPAHVVRRPIDAFAAEHADAFDMAVSFQVIEHVPDPLAHARAMARMLRPGGLLMLSGPLWPSLLTELPNFPINMPPHHVTWWNVPAFEALAAALGLEVVEVGHLDPAPQQDVVFWMRLFMLTRTDRPPRETFFANRRSWNLNMMAAHAVARRLADRVRPPNRQPIDAFLVARRPSG